MAEEPKSTATGEPQPQGQAQAEPLDYRKELFDLLDSMSTLGLQIALNANNNKARIRELESKQGLVP